MDRCEISNRRLLDETRHKKVRGSPTKNSGGRHSGELLQKRTCWTNANMSERFVTVLPTTKNCGLRANDQMAKMGCRQEKFAECESGCAYYGITDFCDKHVDEGSTQLLCTTDGDLDLEIRTLSANVIESAAWIEVTRPWFLLQTYCEHWKCVNRRLLRCRAMV